MHANIAELGVRDATIGSLSIGHLGIGPITVRELTVADTTLTMSGAHGLLQGVTAKLTLGISVEWSVHIGLPWPFDDIDLGDTYDLGSFDFTMPVGDISLPHLDDLHFAVPSLSAQNVGVPATALSLTLTGATAEQIRATGVTAPSAGFSLAGLLLSSVDADAITLPAASVDAATVGHLTGDPITIPALTLPSVSLPTVQLPLVNSTTPLTIPADLEGISPGFDAGLLKVVLHFRPSVETHVQQLTLTDAAATASTGAVVLHDVRLPFDVTELTLSHLGIDSVDVPTLSIS